MFIELRQWVGTEQITRIDSDCIYEGECFVWIDHRNAEVYHPVMEPYFARLADVGKLIQW